MCTQAIVTLFVHKAWAVGMVNIDVVGIGRHSIALHRTSHTPLVLHAYNMRIADSRSPKDATMGWEWRVFFSLETAPDQPPAPDVWQLLGCPDLARSSPERRTDVYLKSAHGAGLKVRGEKRFGLTLLEAKLRSRRAEDSGLEKWEKVDKLRNYFFCFAGCLCRSNCW